MNTKGLARNQLKLIAIIAMVIDHTAWGFVEFMSPLGQFMHVIGRMTIPIMCFFIAEGFRKTSNIRKYLYRMIVFWLITVVPFYLFFGEEYGYRQSIIFDLMLGLLALIVTESKEIKKHQKALLITCLYVISMTLGGWPILPMSYILIFYYGKDFKTQAKRICIFTVSFVAVLLVIILLNNQYHFSSYDWYWYERVYLLGFMLALPLIRLYNGQKGLSGFGRYFFYCFYPAHFLILYTIKLSYQSAGLYGLYVFSHTFALLVVLALLAYVLSSKPSKAMVANVFFTSFTVMYMLGFLLEITSIDLDILCTAVKIEYIAECFVFIGVTWFFSCFTRIRIPNGIYVFELIVSIITIGAILTMQQNTFFYKNIDVYIGEPFPRLDLTYGVGFYLFIGYIAILSLYLLILCIHAFRNSVGTEKRRIAWILGGLICPWLVTVMRALNLTGGYEITPLGIIGIGICLAMALVRYGFFDSVQAAYENAMNHRNEALMVINHDHRITYMNNFMKNLLPEIREDMNAYNNEQLFSYFSGNERFFEKDDKTYEIRTNSLMESGFVQGYILWFVDVTEHIKRLNKAVDIAHTDSLTGLYNRKYYEEEVKQILSDNKSGSMFMFDIDDFKSINDTYGHGVGDEVLIALSQALKSVSDYSFIPCRMGGDEFNAFADSITDSDKLENITEQIIDIFVNYLKEHNLPEHITISIGIAQHNGNSTSNAADIFAELYNKADKALYLSKNKGKNQYNIFKA